MSSKSLLSLSAAAVFGVAFLSSSGIAAPTQGKMERKGLRYSDVKRLLDTRCVGCHNDRRHPEGVDLSSYDKIMKGGEKGPIVVPGRPEQSKIVLYVDGSRQPRMPLKQKPLDERAIHELHTWVAGGAKP